MLIINDICNWDERNAVQWSLIYVIIGLTEGETDLTEFYRTVITSSMNTLALT